jgi:membrane-bound serine protease (ClpP class)
MAPGTHIGAAHPVTAGGKDPGGEGREQMGRKVENATAAFARSIAQRRGRNAEWAERAVRESVTQTAKEALKAKVVDLIVADEASLMEALDGRVVTLDGGTRRLATKGLSPVPFDMSLRQRVLAFLGNPSLAYILMMIGLLGLLIEFYQPGLIVPGALGAVSLLLAMMGLGTLPVEAGAVVLIVVAAALFVAELMVVSYGLLALGGIAALVLGSLLLIDPGDPEYFVDPSLEVSWTVVVPTALVLAGAVVGLALQAGRLFRKQARTGAGGMMGARGVTDGEVGPSGGHVRSGGERWRAYSAEVIAPGTTVEVIDINGLELEVRRVGGDRTSSADKRTSFAGKGTSPSENQPRHQKTKETSK